MLECACQCLHELSKPSYSLNSSLDGARVGFPLNSTFSSARFPPPLYENCQMTEDYELELGLGRRESPVIPA